MPRPVVGGSITFSLVTACAFDLAVPSLLHWLKLDPKIAAGPVTLVLTDFFALAIYFTSASLVLTMSHVSVVIPALNEEEPIAGVVRDCLTTGVPGEVIVVDNGSTDRTAERARAAGARVVNCARGYGRRARPEFARFGRRDAMTS